jgi:xanthine dehydrogenase YagS FAD-binding subunit
MRPFDLRTVADVAEARAALLERPGAKLVAGGTGLIDLMKAGVESPSLVIDINRLPLAAIELRAGGTLRIGALARNSAVADDPTVAARFPVLAQALLAGASGALRNMATVGGNLLQRPRCAYFREPYARCNRRVPGSGCDALEGYNRAHAILGTSDHCIAVHPSDMCVALAALDARIVVAGADGERSLTLAEFYPLPGAHPERESALAPGDLIVGVELEPAALYARSHYLKLRDRASYEFALVAVGAALEVVDGTIRAARIALGGVATVPWRAHAAERALIGATADARSFAAAADAALEGAMPRRHNAFKVELTRRAILRALRTLAEPAGR